MLATSKRLWQQLGAFKGTLEARVKCGGGTEEGEFAGEEMLKCDEGCGAEPTIGRATSFFGLDGICVFVNRVWIISKGERSSEEEGGWKYEREIDEYFGVPSRSSPGLEYWLSTGS
jgi:hypothetical protein